MIVILKQDVQGTGRAGEIVKVSDGFARNMLIPKGLAVEATKGNIHSLEKQKELQQRQLAEQKAAAEKQAQDLAEKKVVIKTKAGEGGRLFGSITSKDVSDAIKEQLGINIDKKKIEMDGPIKQLGITEVTIKLFQEVKGKLKVELIEE